MEFHFVAHLLLDCAASEPVADDSHSASASRRKVAGRMEADM
jgi:hypothetical protein